jgi:hypothetical protein
VYLPWEARVGGPTQFRWMHSQERELKKHRVIVRNKAMVESCIEAFMCKEITNFSSKYFSCANNVSAHTMQYHIVEVPLSELSISNGMVKVLGLLVHIMSRMMSGQPTLKKLDSMRQHGVKGGPSFPKWFRLHVIFHFALFHF